LFYSYISMLGTICQQTTNLQILTKDNMVATKNYGFLFHHICYMTTITLWNHQQPSHLSHSVMMLATHCTSKFRHSRSFLESAVPLKCHKPGQQCLLSTQPNAV
jgi:hypothetical protein